MRIQRYTAIDFQGSSKMTLKRPIYPFLKGVSKNSLVATYRTIELQMEA